MKSNVWISYPRGMLQMAPAAPTTMTYDSRIGKTSWQIVRGNDNNNCSLYRYPSWTPGNLKISIVTVLGVFITHVRMHSTSFMVAIGQP